MPFADTVMLNELEASIDAFDRLEGAALPWATPLLARTRATIARARVVRIDPASYRRAPVDSGEKSLLFELRVARDLALNNVDAEYEFCSGVGSTTVDFRLPGAGKQWLVELVSFRESEAFKAASWQSEIQFGYILESGADDPRQSCEGELLKAQERVVAKVFDGNRPVKFPVPSHSINMILVDARGYMGDGHGDVHDWNHLVYGARAVPDGYAQFWTNPKTGIAAPIAGVFEPACPLRGAEVLRTRIHVVGFVCEKSYSPGEISARALYRCNPALFVDEEEARRTMSDFPLRRRG